MVDFIGGDTTSNPSKTRVEMVEQFQIGKIDGEKFLPKMLTKTSMADEKGRVNTKDVMTSIVARTMTYVHGQIMKDYGKLFVQWAKEYGANINDDQVSGALERLQVLIPEPVQWPSLEVKARDGMTVKSTKPPRAPHTKEDHGTGKKSRKAADFNPLVVPDGMQPPTCQVKYKSGNKKGQFCGRPCVRVLDEHDMTDDNCINLRCNHMFCGMHISKAGGNKEVAALDRLKKAEAAETITANGKTIDANATSGISEASAETAASATMQKIMARVKNRTASPALAE